MEYCRTVGRGGCAVCHHMAFASDCGGRHYWSYGSLGMAGIKEDLEAILSLRAGRVQMDQDRLSCRG